MLQKALDALQAGFDSEDLSTRDARSSAWRC